MCLCAGDASGEVWGDRQALSLEFIGVPLMSYNIFSLFISFHSLGGCAFFEKTLEVGGAIEDVLLVAEESR